ncbi:uncharacterized protein LOC144877099 isoform X2 [Branchiostoma floridae x Branchiostoma japonicum]
MLLLYPGKSVSVNTSSDSASSTTNTCQPSATSSTTNTCQPSATSSTTNTCQPSATSSTANTCQPSATSSTTNTCQPSATSSTTNTCQPSATSSTANTCQPSATSSTTNTCQPSATSSTANTCQPSATSSTTNTCQPSATSSTTNTCQPSATSSTANTCQPSATSSTTNTCQPSATSSTTNTCQPSATSSTTNTCQPTSTLASTDTCSHDLLDLPFNDHYNFSTKAFADMMDTHMRKTTLTKEEQMKIEEETRGQSSSNAWREVRQVKLTASNFKSAISCTVEPSNKIKAMLYNNFSTAATAYGNRNEAVAVEEYVDLIQEEHPGAQCVEAGLILSLERPWLGASVDRLVMKDGHNIGGLEVKCPFSKQGLSVEDASQDSRFFLKNVENKITLKTNHKYYDQVQGQLYCCSLEWVDFVVYFGPGRIFRERIFVNTEWQEKNLPKLDHFYRTAVLPELLSRRVRRGKKLYGTDRAEKWKPL